MLKINFSNIKQSRIYILIIVIAFTIYGNSINNEYSLDDNIVVDGVAKIENGIKGFSEIFTTHYAVDKKQQYSYRPIVSLTFALEKFVFKGLPESQTIKEKKKKDRLTQANVSHFINVFLYCLTSIFLFKFLLLLFRDYNVLLPVLVTLFFIVHPLHTEVVANIKSRDELLVFLGVLIALTNYLKFSFTSKYKYLLYACLAILVAFLSKKTAFVVLGIVPVVLYFANAKLKKIVLSMATLFGLVILVIMMKKGLVSESSFRELKFFENPLFTDGNFMDRLATGFYCVWFYLKMLIFPKDLSFYYGYSHIPIVDWSFYQVWLGILFYVPLLFYGMWLLTKRNVLGLGIVLWLGVMFAYLNIISPVVGVVADRFTYVFSLGFCIVVVILLLKVFKVDFKKEVFKVQLSSEFLITIAIVLLAYSGRVVIRNPDWHDYLTTYYHDVEVVENSAKVHSLIANTLYTVIAKSRQDPKNFNRANEVIKHYKRAIDIDSTYVTCLSNLGSAYIDMKKDNEAGIYYCGQALVYKSDYLEANLNLGVAYERINKPDSAMKYLLRCVEINPEHLSVYNVLNNFLSKSNMVEEGINRLIKLSSFSDQPKSIYMNIANLYSINPDNINLTLLYFEKAFALDKTDKRLCRHLGDLYKARGNKKKADFYFNLFNNL